MIKEKDIDPESLFGCKPDQVGFMECHSGTNKLSDEFEYLRRTKDVQYVTYGYRPCPIRGHNHNYAPCYVAECSRLPKVHNLGDDENAKLFSDGYVWGIVLAAHDTVNARVVAVMVLSDFLERKGIEHDIMYHGSQDNGLVPFDTNYYSRLEGISNDDEGGFVVGDSSNNPIERRTFSAVFVKSMDDNKTVYTLTEIPKEKWLGFLHEPKSQDDLDKETSLDIHIVGSSYDNYATYFHEKKKHVQRGNWVHTFYDTLYRFCEERDLKIKETSSGQINLVIGYNKSDEPRIEERDNNRCYVRESIAGRISLLTHFSISRDTSYYIVVRGEYGLVKKYIDGIRYRMAMEGFTITNTEDDHKIAPTVEQVTNGEC